MTIRCIDCKREITEWPLCGDCAAVVAATVMALQRGRRPTRRELYRHDPRPTPPITLPTVRFGKGGETA